MYKNIVLALSAIVFLASCEKEITVKVPAYTPKLVINSNTEVGDSFEVTIGKSVEILKYKANKDLSVIDATVMLYKGSVVADTMKYNMEKRAYTSDIVARDGDVYNIKVNAPNMPEATSVTNVPSFVPIADIQRIKKTRLDAEGQQQDELRIRFNDPASRGDYYILSVYSNYDSSNVYNYSYGCIYTVDASVESVYDESIDQNTCLDGNAIFIRDALFNGITKELRLFVNSALMEPYEVDGDMVYPKVILRHVTEDYFKFQKTYRFASANAGNPFAEPTNVYTNVNNGYGVFSVLSYSAKDVK